MHFSTKLCKSVQNTLDPNRAQNVNNRNQVEQLLKKIAYQLQMHGIQISQRIAEKLRMQIKIKIHKIIGAYYWNMESSEINYCRKNGENLSAR